MVRITDPAGKVTVSSGTSTTAKPLKVTVKNAAAGAYTIDITDSFVCCGPSEYAAVAELSFGGTPTAPAAPAPLAAAPAPAAETKLTVKGASASAKKLNRVKKLSAALTSTGPLTRVKVVLVKGKKQLGRGTLTTLDGKAKVTLKLTSKLKAGSYGLAAAGTDAQGRSVVAGAKFTLKK
jgi:hypothetical protein